MSFWTEEKTDLLKQLWLSATPAKKIAATLEAPSKNAVLGKAFRLGLSHRGPKQSTKGVPKKRIRIDRGGAGFRPLKSPPRPPRTPAEVTDDNARILALKPTVFGIENFEPASMCGYIHGEPSEQARCGRKRVLGLPYCEDHARLCKAPPEPSRRKAPDFKPRENPYLGYARKTAADLLNA